MEQVLNRCLDEITALSLQLVEAEKRLKPDDPYQSPQINELVTALAKAQGTYPQICSDRQGHNHKYADLDGIFLAVRPSLEKNGLSISQPTKVDASGATMLHTRVYHSSGQWIETRTRVIPEKNTLQGYGTAMTYMRRYQIVTILGISVDKDPTDNDGEKTLSEVTDSIKKRPANDYNPKEQSYETITPEQLEQIEYELKDDPDIAEAVLDTLRINCLADMPKSSFQSNLDEIRRIKHKQKQVKTK
jgi:hypothetical protein